MILQKYAICSVSHRVLYAIMNLRELIESTVEPPSKRRNYSDEQISAIRKVLALRSLGLSVKKLKICLLTNAH